MDESLKARLIGAVVLVALAVILIPELLSGRKPATPAPEPANGERATRTFTIELGGGSTEILPSTDTPPAPERKSPPSIEVPEPVVREAAPSTAASGQPVQPTPATPDRAIAEAPAAEAPPPASATAGTGTAAVPVPAESAAPVAPARPARGGWAVQVGAFGSVSSANKLVKELQGAGYTAFVSPVTRGGKTLHRVRVGPQSERAAAEQLLAGLKGRGLPATVVAND
jgi:DedD protein